MYLLNINLSIFPGGTIHFNSNCKSGKKTEIKNWSVFPTCGNQINYDIEYI
jgi:hypothetical protein